MSITKKNIEVKLSEIPSADSEISSNNLLKIKNLAKIKIINKLNDAQTMAQTMISIQNPYLVESIERFASNSKYLGLFEEMNLGIIESIAGTNLYSFGIGNEALKIDKDIYSGFIQAVTSLFYSEMQFKFDSYVFEAKNFKHKLKVYVYRNKYYIASAVWTKDIGKSLNIRFDKATAVIREFIDSLPEIKEK